MIIDEKTLMHPPPPYVDSPGLPPFPSTARRAPTLTTLPPHLLLAIIYATFPQTPHPDESTPARQRRTLYWLSVSLRLVNRTLYATAMHVLRSTHLPAYAALVRPPYSSDPFPLVADSASTPLTSLQRETATLDRFIALKVREDVWADATDLHLSRPEAYRDLFDLAQPRARLEDLVRIYGIREGCVCVGAPPKPPSAVPQGSAKGKKDLARTPSNASTASLRASPSSTSFLASLFSSKSKSKSKQPSLPTPPPQPTPPPTPISFHLLSVTFSPRAAALVLSSGTPALSASLLVTSSSTPPVRRTIVSTPRARDEPLEAAAKRLVRELRSWLAEGG
ncbi:hypothetical protein H0H81_011776 [Sphagnurus paluster]|uniref:Uncharacterized protein n=1 Tax=Sphagnurus paluster TaxID=117069 RepID=A0A9P7FNK1_9AGAR|nr:hypothetical protein H0H81_011776 [Sphagnurus paluster]